jgi:hypothetical protein
VSRACNTNGERRKHIGYRWESQKKRDHQEGQYVGGWILLKY